MNTIIIIGRLTKDPEIRTTNSGKNVTTFSVAVRRNNDSSDFFNCVAFGKTAEFVEKYFHKGNMIAVEGAMHSEQYEKDGKKQTVWKLSANNVSFCESKPAEKETAYVDELPDDDFPF